jgi:hypothetical protein
MAMLRRRYGELEAFPIDYAKRDCLETGLPARLLQIDPGSQLDWLVGWFDRWQVSRFILYGNGHALRLEVTRPAPAPVAWLEELVDASVKLPPKRLGRTAGSLLANLEDPPCTRRELFEVLRSYSGETAGTHRIDIISGSGLATCFSFTKVD